MITKWNRKYKKYVAENPDSSLENAYIIGSFTNWEPRKMMLIDELIAHINKESHILDDIISK